MMFERQIRGIIAIAIFLAFIPFIFFFVSPRLNSPTPLFSNSSSETIIVEVVEENGLSGIYFVGRGTSVNQILARLEISKRLPLDFELQNGARISLVAQDDHEQIVIEKMEGAKRLALGLPLNINQADRDELMLISGIGDALAGQIVQTRQKTGHFKNLEQLKKVKGIKQAKLQKISPYLYVDQ